MEVNTTDLSTLVVVVQREFSGLPLLAKPMAIGAAESGNRISGYNARGSYVCVCVTCFDIVLHDIVHQHYVNASSSLCCLPIANFHRLFIVQFPLASGWVPDLM